MVQRVKSQSQLCIYVCVCVCERERDRDKWASLCDRQRRDSVTLYITSLPYPDAHIHTHQRGRGCTATADRKQGCSSPLYVSPSQPTCLHTTPYIPLFKPTPPSSDFLIPGSPLVTALSICGKNKLTVLEQGSPQIQQKWHTTFSPFPLSTQNVGMRAVHWLLIQTAFDLLVEDSHGLILCCYCLLSATAHPFTAVLSWTQKIQVVSDLHWTQNRMSWVEQPGQTVLAVWQPKQV